jgi:putative mRNA 3-end processing factor
MKVQFQNANDGNGNQSSLFVFHPDKGSDDTNIYALLVDAGRGVDLSESLYEGEFLSGTLLTHAHVDHLASLDEATRDNAPIYATPETATIVEHTLQTDASAYGINNPRKIIQNLTPIRDSWETTAGGLVDIYPIPVGHTPGAAGFLLHFDGQTVFVTGDFTTHPVAGNPPLDPTFGGLLSNDINDITTVSLSDTIENKLNSSGRKEESKSLFIDALHINATHATSSKEKFQNATENIYKASLSDNQTVVTASSLAGTHLARLLSTAKDEVAGDFDIHLLGKTGRIYRALGHDDPHVHVFDELSRLPNATQSDGSYSLSPDSNQTIIAGPGNASRGTSKRVLELFKQSTKQSAELNVIQLLETKHGLTGQNTSNLSETHPSSWNIQRFTYAQHPTEEEIEVVTNIINPSHLMFNHIDGKDNFDKWADRARKFQAIVWSGYGQNRYNIYHDGWQDPNWVNDNFSRSILGKQQENSKRPSEQELPTATTGDISLEQECIDESSLSDIASMRTKGIPQQHTDQTTSTPPTSEEASATSTASQKDSSKEKTASSSSNHSSKNGQQAASHKESSQDIALSPIAIALINGAVDGDLSFSQDSIKAGSPMEFITSSLELFISKSLENGPPQKAAFASPRDTVDDSSLLASFLDADFSPSFHSLIQPQINTSTNNYPEDIFSEPQISQKHQYIDSLVKNPETEFSSRSDVLHAAITYTIRTSSYCRTAHHGT